MGFLLNNTQLIATDQNQGIVDNLDMFLSTQYIESNDDLYMYLEISIWNRNVDSIYLLKDYNLENIIEEENGIILYLSSWVDHLDLLKYTSALYHNPRMIEIRSRQLVYIPLFLKVPNEFQIINTNNVIKEIIGLKYSLQQYITEDITWASDVDSFALGILERVADLNFIFNEYTRKYGNLVISQIRPPEWMFGVWVTDGRTLPGGEIINSTSRYLTVVADDFFLQRLVGNDRYINESIHGWLLTRSENRITQSYGENYYRLNINFLNGRMDYYYFFIENDYLIMHHNNQNGLFIFRYERER